MLFIIRLITLLVSTAALGLAIVAIVYYYRLQGRRSLIPVEGQHAFLIALSYFGVVISGLVNLMDSIRQREAFHWYLSPLLLISSGVAVFGLIRLIGFERTIPKVVSDED